MGIFDKIKRTVQRIIPGGKTGREIKGKVPTGGTDKQVSEQRKAAGQSERTDNALKRRSSGGSSKKSTFDKVKDAGSRALDIISAPLSKPKTTFTKGIGAGADAVRESRGLIAGGDTREALKVVGTTVASTAVAAAAVLGTAAGATAIQGLVASGGAGSVSVVANKAAQLGVNPKVLQKAVDKVVFNQAVGDLAKIATRKTFIGLTKKQLTVAASTLVGGSVLTQWLAADNAAGAASFMSTKIQSRFDNNELTRDDALEQIDGQIAIIKGADKFTKLNTIINPALWAFRKMYVSTVENNLVTAEETRRLIEISPETTASKFDRLREESNARDQAFADKQEARDEAFAEGQEKSKRESDAEFSERTLLFEAIRKRNAGTELTPEEMALLIKYGLDTKIVQSGGYEAPSALNFGLF